MTTRDLHNDMVRPTFAICRRFLFSNTRAFSARARLFLGMLGLSMISSGLFASDLSIGDEIVVGRQPVPVLVSGGTTLVKPDQHLQVLQVNGSFLLVETGGRRGWIHRNHVLKAETPLQFTKEPYPLAAVVGKYRINPSLLLSEVMANPGIIERLQVSGREQEVIDMEAPLQTGLGISRSENVSISLLGLFGAIGSAHASHGNRSQAVARFEMLAKSLRSQLSRSGVNPAKQIAPFPSPEGGYAHFLAASGWCIANSGELDSGSRHLKYATDWLRQELSQRGPENVWSSVDERAHIWHCHVLLQQQQIEKAKAELVETRKRRAAYQNWLAQASLLREPSLDGRRGHAEMLQALLDYSDGNLESAEDWTVRASRMVLRCELDPAQFGDVFLEMRVRERADYQSGDNFDRTWAVHRAHALHRHLKAARPDSLAGVECLLNMNGQQEACLGVQHRALHMLSEPAESSFGIIDGTVPVPAMDSVRCLRGVVADFALRQYPQQDLITARREFEDLRAAGMEFLQPRLWELPSVPIPVRQEYAQSDFRNFLMASSREEDLSPERLRHLRLSVSNWLDQAVNEQWISVEQVQQHLDAGQCFLAFARYQDLDVESLATSYRELPSRFVATIVPKTGRPQYLDLGLAEPIENEIASLRTILARVPELIRNKTFLEPQACHEWRMACHKIQELLVAPLRSSLSQHQSIVIIPDATLWLLPWTALPWDEQHLFIDRFNISLATNCRSWMGRELSLYPPSRPPLATAPPLGPPLLIGDPDFNAPWDAISSAEQAVCGRTLDNPLIEVARRGDSLLGPAKPLPSSREEIEGIAPLVEQYCGVTPNVFLGRQAIEGVFHRHVNPRILLISSHGFFLADPPTAAGWAKIPIRDATMQSGLLLAGCNTRDAHPVYRETDGVLTGYEVGLLDLRDTELVVLSACETGVGSIKPFEGVRGLRQSFMTAGAESVVASLWQVPDRDSTEIMRSFFEHLINGRSRSSALQQAQLDRISIRKTRYGAAHPFFWAAWTLTE